MAEWLKVVILGLVEGITEFLPVSSTGHLIIANSILDFRPNLATTFDIFIQLGAVLAVVVFYAHDLLKQVRAVPHDQGIQRFWMSIIIAFIPAATIGFLFSDAIEAALFNPTVVALALIIGGILFIVVERYATPQTDNGEITQITFKQAGIVGLCQLAALIPGMSRSGMTILGGMWAGLPRSVATQFSFYLAIPTLGIATVYALLKNLDQINGADLVYLGLGTVIAGIIAWLAIAWLLRYIAGHSFVVFGYYRIIVGVFILLLVAVGSM